MRRWLAILLLVLLPLQSVWAAAAAYCQHETGAGAQHFGHHEHKHHQGSADTSNSSDVPSFAVDADCAVCHAVCAAATVDVPSLVVDISRPAITPWYLHAPVSPPTAQPERPNWSFPV